MVILKKKSSLITYEVHSTIPNVYTVVVPDSYERAMLFVRFQEYYESPYKKFQGKNFNLFEFMNNYRKERGCGHFSYPSEWSGYNIPSEYLIACLMYLKDPTVYDLEMSSIYSSILADIKSKNLNMKTPKFYIIGVDSMKSSVMDHEIAHAFFYTDEDYKKHMSKLVKLMNPKKREKLTNYLLKIGYRKQVITDEIQAFMSTGLTGEMEKIIGAKERAPFVWAFDSMQGSFLFK